MGDLEQSAIERMTDKEIMQVLSLCLDKDSDCRTCRLWSIDRCVEPLLRGAEGLIERRTAERDTLVELIKERHDCRDCKNNDFCEYNDVIECMNCVKKECPCAGCRDSSRWEWRGFPEVPEGGEM